MRLMRLLIFTSDGTIPKFFTIPIPIPRKYFLTIPIPITIPILYIIPRFYPHSGAYIEYSLA